MSSRPFTLPPGSQFRLQDFDPGWTGEFSGKKEARDEMGLARYPGPVPNIESYVIPE